MRRIIRYSIVIVILGLMIGCGEEEPSNNPPVVNSFTASSTEVAPGAEVTLVVLATDPDSDVLTYKYQTAGGTIIGMGNTVKWVAPGSAWDHPPHYIGPPHYIITIDVSDGELNAQARITITVLPDEPPKTPMVLIPAGDFQMGDHFNEGWDDEFPVHTVYLDAFYMDIYGVTNAQFQKFMDATGHREPYKWGDSLFNSPEQPVVGVNWHDAVAYAEWAGKRLPTEAEWEYAARGGLSGMKYPWGNDISHGDANYDGAGGRDVWEYTSPVGSFPPNGYGLYDMAGNLWEWCSDVYNQDYYSISPERNPTGPDSGSRRVLRGGSWGDDPSGLRVTPRYGNNPGGANYYMGFRCVFQD